MYVLYFSSTELDTSVDDDDDDSGKDGGNGGRRRKKPSRVRDTCARKLRVNITRLTSSDAQKYGVALAPATPTAPPAKRPRMEVTVSPPASPDDVSTSDDDIEQVERDVELNGKTVTIKLPATVKESVNRYALHLQ